MGKVLDTKFVMKLKFCFIGMLVQPTLDLTKLCEDTQEYTQAVQTTALSLCSFVCSSFQGETHSGPEKHTAENSMHPRKEQVCSQHVFWHRQRACGNHHNAEDPQVALLPSGICFCQANRMTIFFALMSKGKTHRAVVIQSHGFDIF